MSVTYNVRNLAGLVEHFEDMAKRKRDLQNDTTDKARARDAGVEASVFEYCAMVVRQSDIFDHILIPNNDADIRRAAERLSAAEDAINSVRTALFQSGAVMASLRMHLGTITTDDNDG